MLLPLDGLCPGSQAAGAGGQCHDEDAQQEGDQRPEEAVQEDGLVVGALQHDVVWPAKRRSVNPPWQQWNASGVEAIKSSYARISN